MAAEVASFQRDALTELRALPAHSAGILQVAAAPMAFVGLSRIKCCAPGHDWACDLNKERQNVSTMSFIREIRQTRRSCIAFRTSSCRTRNPCARIIEGQGCSEWAAPPSPENEGIVVYRKELVEVGVSSLRVIIAECG